MRTLCILAAGLVGMFTITGCVNQRQTALQERQARSVPVEVKPQWRTFVIMNYQEHVKENLKAPASARFEREPTITASFDPEKKMAMLQASGEVDAQNSYGALIRGDYMVLWGQDAQDALTVGDNWIAGTGRVFPTR